MGSKFFLIISFICLLCLTNLANTADVIYSDLQINSLSTNSQQLNYQKYSSLAGNTTLFIGGSGFSTFNEQNIVFIGGVQCEVTGATNFMLTVFTPPSSKEKTVEVVVYVVENKAPCKITGGCNIQYTDSFSPKLYYIFPRSATPSTIVSFEGYFKLDYTVDDRNIQLQNIRIGQFYCDRYTLEELFWDNIYAYQQVPCRTARDFVGGLYPAYLNHKFRGFSKPMYSLVTMDAKATQYYSFRCVPKIQQISSNVGSPLGQILVIDGFGFSSISNQNKITAAGLNCKPIFSSYDQITCLVQEGDGLQQFSLGGSGFEKKNYSLPNGPQGNALYYKSKLENPSIDTQANPILVSTQTILDLELPQLTFTNFLTSYKGFFYAPRTGNYVFQAAVDDSIVIHLSTQPNTTDSTYLQQIVQVSSWTSFRDYYQSPSQTSDPIALVEGNYYYMEMYHVQGSGGTHFTVSVQVPYDTKTNISVNDIQEVYTTFTPVYETLVFNITKPFKPTQGFWQFYINGYGATTWSRNYTNIPTAAELGGGFNDIGVKSTECTRVSLDINDVETTDNNDIYRYQYTCIFKAFRQPWLPYIFTGRMSSYQTNMIPIIRYYNDSVTKLTSLNATAFTSKIINYPSRPINGTFQLSFNGILSTNIAFNATASDLKNVLTSQLGFDVDTSVIESGIAQDGKKWRIYFNTNRGVQPLIVPVVNNIDLEGGQDGTFPQVLINRLQEGSNNLFYQPIPTDFLFTVAQKTQLNVEVNGVVATCPGFNCDYVVDYASTPIATYIFDQQAAQILFTLSQPATIPEITEDSLTVSFAFHFCDVISFIKNSDSYDVVAQCKKNTNGKMIDIASNGNAAPEIYIQNIGFALLQKKTSRRSLATVLDEWTFPLTISSVQYQLGSSCGYLRMFIVGTGFPDQNLQCDLYCKNVVPGKKPTKETLDCTYCKQLKQNAAQITKELEAKVGSSICNIDVKTVNNTYFECITSEKDIGSGLVVTVNKGTKYEKISSEPSPLFEFVEDEYSQFYGYQICDFVHSDDSTQCQSITTSSPLEKKDIIIQGKGFGDNKNNIQVKLVNTKCSNCSEEDENGVKKPYCCYDLSVWTVEDEKITAVLGGGYSGDYIVTVIKTTFGSLGKFENGAITCHGGYSQFSYQFNLDSVSPSKGSTKGGTVLTLTGVNFNTDTTQNRNLVFIGDYNVPCDVITKGVKSTQIQCITRETDETYGSSPQPLFAVQRVSEEAKCTSVCQFTYDSTITPKISDEPVVLNVQAGTELVFNGQNLMPETGLKAILYFNSTYSTESTFESDSQLKFNVIALPQEGIYTLKIQVQNIGYAVIDAGLVVNYTFITTTKPTITSVNLASNPDGFLNSLLTITGTNLISNYNIQVKLILQINNVDSDIIISQALDNNVDDATKIIVNFYDSTQEVSSSNQQIPAGNYKVQVKFYEFGVFNATTSITVSLQNIAIQNSPIVSSYAGDIITLTGTGFFSDPEQQSQNQISVCGLPCSVQSATYGQVQCKLSFISTEYSISQYQLPIPITSATPAAGFSDKGATLAATVFDGLYSSSYYSTSASCYIGLDFGQDYVIDIYQIQFYPKLTQAKTKFKQSRFEGSNDLTNWETIFNVNYIQDGWNTWINQEDFKQTFKYRYVRFLQPSNSGNYQSQCQLSELRVVGRKIYQDSADQENVKCEVKVTVNGQSTTFAKTNPLVIYQNSLTAKVLALDPDMGTSLGGTTLTITGEGFGTDSTVAKVLIDNVECQISSITDTQIICVTGKRDMFQESSLQVTINGHQAANHDNLYLYVDRWSDVTTWGGEQPPKFNESAIISKGQHILFDVDNPASECLWSINIVGGSLIFEDWGRVSDPEKQGKTLHFNAHYVMAVGGNIIIGTEKKPYLGKIEITLHGDKKDKQLPMFGNKLMVVYEGIFDVHGIKREPTWTFMSQTAEVGDTSITLEREVDWQVGEQIVIAPTQLYFWLEDKDFNNGTETRFISSISVVNGKSVISFVEPLEYRHYSAIEDYDGEKFPMKCEVGLLTRNIVFQGDENSVANKYGGHTMLFGQEEKGTIGRIEYAEFRYMGQQTILSRYPIHFHLNGPVSRSYVIGNSVHDSIARITTLHGISFLRVQKNVGYKISGHAIFIEDGSETNNIIEDNLVVQTIQVWTLVSTDVIASSYWVTNPYNFLRRNHAAGSDWFCFWYELFPFPEGPTSNPAVFIEGQSLGAFQDNVAHACAKYGFRAKTHIPRERPEDPERPMNLLSMDELVEDVQSPWTYNPSVLSVYENFTAFKCGDNGFQFEDMGHITVKTIRTADCYMSGIAIWSIYFSANNTCRIEDALIVGFSQGNAVWPKEIPERELKVVGIIAPNSDGLVVSNARPAGAQATNNPNDEERFVALESCARCDDKKRRTSGGITTYFEKLKFTNVDNKIYWQPTEKNDIFIDADGSLTELGSAKSPYYITHYYGHLLDRNDVQSNKCWRDTSRAYDDSVICDNQQQIRSIMFKEVLKSEIFQGIGIRFHQVWDQPQALYPNTSFADDLTQSEFIIDEDTSTFYQSSDTSSCFVGAAFGSSPVEITSVKYFPIQAQSAYANVKFQGSYDGITYQLIFNVTNQIAFNQDNWNVYTVANVSNPMFYRYYRFIETAPSGQTILSGCQFAEIQFFGKQFAQQVQPPRFVKKYKWAWSMPFITGKTYNVHWLTGLDFDSANVHPSFSWLPQDKPIILRFNYSTARELVEVCRNYYVHSTCQVPKEQYDYNNSQTSLTQANTLFGKNYIDRDNEQFYLGVAGDVNGTMHLVPKKCINTCPTPIVDCKEDQKFKDVYKWSTTEKFWKKPTADGAQVVIPCSWSMLIDVDTVELDKLEINGLVYFDDSKPGVTLKAKKIWVRDGILRAGTPDTPLTSNQRILLTGGQFDDNLVIDDSLDPYNKVLSVTSKLELYGLIPKIPYTRLLDYAKTGTNVIQVDLSDSRQISNGTVDWLVGNKIVIGPTGLNPKEYETVTIKSISGNTITLEENLAYDHYGAADITDKYQVTNKNIMELDMRAVVGLLSRNIVIEGDDQDEHGCHIHIAGYHEKQVDDSYKFKRGNAQLYGVEIRKCGQVNTERASLDIRNLAGNSSSVATTVFGSAIHTARGWGMDMVNSYQIQVQYTVFADCDKKLLSGFENNNYIKIENNFLVGARFRNIDFQELEYDVKAGLDFYQTPPVIKITDNIVQGVDDGPALLVQGATCTNNKDLIFQADNKDQQENDIDEGDDDLYNPPKDRIIMNNSLSSSKVGLIHLINSQNDACDKMADLTIYKCHTGIISHFTVRRLIVKRMIFAENTNAYHYTPAYENFDFPFNKMLYKKLYINAIARPNCIECYQPGDCRNMVGAVMSGHNRAPKTWPPKALFIDSICKDQDYNQLTVYDQVTFKNFNTRYSATINNEPSPWDSNINIKQNCANNILFQDYPVYEEDTAPTYMIKTKYINVEESAYVKFLSPDIDKLGWLGGCGKLVCTGRENVFIIDVDSKMQMMGPNPSFANQKNCQWIQQWNGYKCINSDKKSTDYMRLEFDVTSNDNRGRLVAPINITTFNADATIDYKSIINAHKEWAWNGKLPLDQRLQRFNAIIPKNKIIKLEYASQIPYAQRYQLVPFAYKKYKDYEYTSDLQSEKEDDYAIVEFQIDITLTLAVYVGKTWNGTKLVRSIPLQKTEGGVYYPKENFWERRDCGANVFFFDNRTLTFILNRKVDCMVHVTQTDSLFVTMRFQTTLNDFFKNDGEASFIDKISAFLQISPDRVRIVAIRQGSVIIDYYIDDQWKPEDEDKAFATARLQTIQDKLVQGVQQNSFNFKSGQVQLVNTTIVITQPINQGASQSEQQKSSGSNSGTSNLFTNFTYNSENIQPVVVIKKSESKGSTTELILSVVIPLIVLLILGVAMTLYIRSKKLKLKAERMGTEKQSSKPYSKVQLQTPPQEEQTPKEELSRDMEKY